MPPPRDFKVEYANQLKRTKQKAWKVFKYIKNMERDVAQNSIECTFDAGKLGLTWEVRDKAIHVTSVEEGGQAMEHAVQVGWCIEKLDGAADLQLLNPNSDVYPESHVLTFRRYREDGLTSEKGKLLLLQQQAAAYKYIADLLIKQTAALEEKDMEIELSEQDREDMDRKYENMTELLKRISRAFDEAMVAKPALCTRVYEHFKCIMQKYPKICGTSVVTGGLLGALYGAGILGGVNLNLFWWLPDWISGVWGFKLSLCAGTSGIVAGLAIVGVITFLEFAIYVANDMLSSEIDDAKAAQKELNDAIEKLKANPLPVSELVELRELYERGYMWPLQEPKADDECLICHEGFTYHGCISHCEQCDDPVRAPGCRRAHFVHGKCLKKWTAESSSLKCLGCDPLHTDPGDTVN